MSRFNCTIDSYVFLRKSIKSGDKLAVSGTDTVSKFIKLFTSGKGAVINNKRSEINHVGMFIWVKERLFVIEAEWNLFGTKQVHLVRFSKEYAKYKGRIFVVRPKLESKELKNYVYRMLDLVGDPYDLNSVIKQISNKTKYKLDRKQYCSEALNCSREWFYTDGKLKHIKPHPLIMKEPNFKFEIRQGSI